MKNSVRLIAMTAPIHDAEFLANEEGELGLDNLIQYYESLGVMPWYMLDLTFLITLDPKYTGEFLPWFRPDQLGTSLTEDLDNGHDTIVVKTTFASLATKFSDVAGDYEETGKVIREVFGTMYDMVSQDFPEVFDRSPRELVLG